MDQFTSTVICSLIAAVVSIVSLLIQRNQNKVIDKIDEQTMFIEKEKRTRQKLVHKEKERDAIINEMMLMVMETNMMILNNTQIGENVSTEEFEKAVQLKEEYQRVAKEIEDIQKEYDIILDMSSQLQHEMEQNSD